MDDNKKQKKVTALNPDCCRWSTPTMDKPMRKVTVTQKTWPQGYQLPPVIEEIGTGLFHEWGMDFEEFDNGPANYTVAVVEMPDGSVSLVNPTNIIFKS